MQSYIQKDLLFSMRILLTPQLYHDRTSRDFSKPEAHMVLDDDSSKFLLFFDSSYFSLSRQQLTVYQTTKVDELQLVQKGVFKSWVGPLRGLLRVFYSFITV